jgi:hypothetical protein
VDNIYTEARVSIKGLLGDSIQRSFVKSFSEKFSKRFRNCSIRGPVEYSARGSAIGSASLLGGSAGGNRFSAEVQKQVRGLRNRFNRVSTRFSRKSINRPIKFST